MTSKIPSSGAYSPEQDSDSDLWFLPGPPEDEPDFLPTGSRTSPQETSLLEDWRKAEASLVAQLARVAGRFGALDERLRRGPEGWRHRLALIEAAELSWFSGDRIGADRLALWVGLRLSGVQEDSRALARVSWAVRRLSGGQGPEHDLAQFLGRHDSEQNALDHESFSDHADAWRSTMSAALPLHPISRACYGFHHWALAGLGQQGDRIEAAVTAARIAASESRGAVFAPLAMGGAEGLRAGGLPHARLERWLAGMESACLSAMRQLDDIEAWNERACKAMTKLSGRTPPALRTILMEWPLVSAPMAEAMTGASRAAVQRNLALMEAQGLIREVTRQGRFRMWRIT